MLLSLFNFVAAICRNLVRALSVRIAWNVVLVAVFPTLHAIPFVAALALVLFSSVVLADSGAKFMQEFEYLSKNEYVNNRAGFFGIAIEAFILAMTVVWCYVIFPFFL